jgi:hypothetical protein
MNTPTIAERLPIDAVTIDAVTDAVAESAHRVSGLVPDHIPDAVTDAIGEGVSRSRRVGRRLAQSLPGQSKTTSTRRWVIAASAIGLICAVLVVWRVRASRSEPLDAQRDAWRLTDADRSVA